MSKNFWFPPSSQPTTNQPLNDPYAKLFEVFIRGMMKEQKKKEKKEAEKKPEEKKKEHVFTYWQTVAICLLTGIPMGAIELIVLKGFGNAFLNALNMR